MTYKAEFLGWKKLTLMDLIVAYRKAKADCYFENGFPSAINFAEFEGDLMGNLRDLLKEWQDNNGPRGLVDYIGHLRLVPKKLSIESKSGSSNGHIHFSNKKRAFSYLCKSNNLIPDFRIVGDFPVKAHILSALWINMVGHKFDACLNNMDIYGARLKREKTDSTNKSEVRPFHLSSVGSFKPYYYPYQQWRADGLNAIRSEIENDRSVVAVSLDLKSYYHTIDPTFISERKFLETIGLVDKKSLSPDEIGLTKKLISLLVKWNKKATEYTDSLTENNQKIEAGLAIGLTASRVISNVLLWKWDKLIREELTPVHYGRYVDDMFLVLNDGGRITDTASFMDFISERLKYQSGQTKKSALIKDDSSNGEIWSIKLPKNYYKETKIQFQATKQRLFMLEGKAGLDLIDNIKAEMYKLSSEHRLMPSLEQFEHSTAAKVLTASDNPSESADTLRRADGLSIHRLSWSIQLRQVETIARDLDPSSWAKERKEFYQFSHDHILRADKILNHYDYLPRLLGLAISLEDWGDANRIVSSSFDALDSLIENIRDQGNIGVINGVQKCELNAQAWESLYKSLIYSFIDCAAKAYPSKPEPTHNKVKRLANTFIENLLERADFDEIFFSSCLDEGFHRIAPKLQRSDLARTPYRFLQKRYGLIKNVETNDDSIEVQRDLYSAFKEQSLFSINSLIKFLAKTQTKRFDKKVKASLDYENIIPFIFPTRPYSSSEIVELLPECIGEGTKSKTTPIRLLAKYMSSVRGSWVSATLLEPTSRGKSFSSKIRVGGQNKERVTVAISSLGTKDSSWDKTACGKPDHSFARYKKLCTLVNSVVSIRPKPDYLFLPELSLPLRWVDSISDRLMGAGINLIAGTEYRHFDNDELTSEVCLVLQDDRLGYKHWTKIWQPKLRPAVGEDKVLTSMFGKKWVNYPEYKLRKPVYNHNGFHFGVMICSELQNSKARVNFQGKVDALAVLSWNQDLETFSALIDSAALDVHAYTILVNNRKYGDSRVRSPAKESYKRDLARLKGGDNDFFVTVKLDIKKLRQFQSRATRWPSDNDPFKPVPEGFVIDAARMVQPPK